MKKNLFFLSILVIVFLGLIYLNNRNESVVSYLRVSFNPDLEFGLNVDNKIIEVIPLNDDAKVLIADEDYLNKDIDSALETLIDEAIDIGYLKEFEDDNVIEITTINENEDERVVLEEKVTARIQERLSNKRVAAVLTAVKLTPDLKLEAEENDVSVGKMMLVEQALYLNNSLEKEELINQSVREIQLEIKKSLNISNEIRMTKKEALEKKEQLRENYSEEIKALKEQIKSRIPNFNSLNEEQKEEILDTEIRILKEKVLENNEELKERIEEYKDDNSSMNISRNIREFIRNERN